MLPVDPESRPADGATVLVLCTGNSCRSQIAEAYLRELSNGRLHALSAGVEPAAEIHPLARRVMAEDGLTLEGQHPKDYRGLLGRAPVHTLITVCDHAAESCPAVWPGVVARLHWPFEDPAAFAGGEEERLVKFREVRDRIKARVRDWLEVGPRPS